MGGADQQKQQLMILAAATVSRRRRGRRDNQSVESSGVDATKVHEILMTRLQKPV